MIKLMIIGNLGKDCTVNNNVNGKTVINFNVAHTEKYKDQSKTTWVECAYWTDKTGISPYLKKGQQVYAEGTVEVRTYETKDGKNGASLTMRVQSIQLLGGRGENMNGEPQQQVQSYNNNSNNNNNGSYQPQKNNYSNNDDMNDAGDDLPF